MQIVCVRCCLDKSATEIFFDEKGVCNFCHSAQKALKEIEAEKHKLPEIIEQTKKDGKGKKYDCLIGLSGGADSSTVLHHAVKLGLRPLAFSLDNGWNKGSESDENILKLVEKLKVPFYRYTIDLKKFKELQAAFMRGGVKNLEAITDHLLMAATYEMADKYKIKRVLSGGNTNTESVMPASWGEDPRDLCWIKSVYKKVTGKKLTGLPVIPLWKEQYYRLVKQIKFTRLLDYLDYDREKSIELLTKLYRYKDYGGKHEESIWTWWYQSFFLFEKYGIDKRKAHYSSLINSGQMTRKEAMNLLIESPIYPKLGIEQKVLKYPKKSYHDYPNSEWIRKMVVKLYKFIPAKWK